MSTIVKGIFDRAASSERLAASITPNDAEVQFNLAAVLEACEQLEESIKAYEIALSGGIERAQENIRVSQMILC